MNCIENNYPNTKAMFSDCIKWFRALFTLVLLLNASAALANLNGHWLDEQANRVRMFKITTIGSSELEVTISGRCNFRGTLNRDTFTTSLRARNTQELARCFPNQSDRDSARRRPHLVTLTGRVTPDQLGIYVKLKMPNATQTSLYISRVPKILGATVIEYGEDQLSPHPQFPAKLLFVYGHYLNDGNGQPRVIASLKPFDQRNPIPTLQYQRLAHGLLNHGATINTSLGTGQTDFDHLRRDRDRTMIEEVWSRAWNSPAVASRLTSGPYPIGHGPSGMLLRVVPMGEVAAGRQKASLSGILPVAWDMSEFERAPPRFCPRFLRQSVYEDFTNFWVDIENMVVLAGPPSILPNSLISYSENDASRLEAQIFKFPQLMAEREASQSLASACPEFSDLSVKQHRKLDKALIGEYYWSKRRLRDGILLTLQNLVALNKLSIMQCPEIERSKLGVSSLLLRPNNRPDSAIPNTLCRDFSLAPGAVSICQRLKTSCRNDQSFAKEVERTSVIYNQWQLIEKPYRQKSSTLHQLEALVITSGRGGAEVRRQTEARVTKLKTEVAKLKEAKDTIEAISSWITQDTFKQVANSQYQACRANSGVGTCDELRPVYACKGMRSQAQELEGKLRSHLNEFTRALSCLENKAACDMDTETFRKTVAKAPSLPPLTLPIDTDSNFFSRTFYTNSQMDWADQRRKQRRYADSINDALNDFYIGAGLTIVTFGVGELALVARGVSASVSSARTARTALTLARAMEVGTIGIDLLASGYEINRAINRCSNAFAQTSQLQPSYYNALEGPNCPINAYDGPRIVEDYKACIFKAVAVEIAFGVLPGVPAAVRTTIDVSTVNSARRALNRANPPFLNGPQRNAIIGLFSRPLSKMSRQGLSDAVAKLERAGFIRTQILNLVGELSPDLLVPLRARFSRLDYAQAVLGRTQPLTQTQADAIMNAHHASPLRKKVDILSAKGEDGNPLFNKTERSDLIRNYVAGDNGTFVRSVKIAVDDLASDLRLLRELLVSDSINHGDLADLINDFDLVLYRARQFQKENKPHRLIDLMNQNSVKSLFEQTRRLDIDTKIELRTYLEKALGKGVIKSFSGADFTKIDRRALGFVDVPRQMQINARQGAMLSQYKGYFTSTDFSDLKSFEADHIVPVSEILRMPGFANLDAINQRLILHNPKNFQSLPKYLNGLKSNLTIGEWSQRMIDRKLGALPVEYVLDFIAIEKQLRSGLMKQIRDLQ